MSAGLDSLFGLTLTAARLGCLKRKSDVSIDCSAMQGGRSVKSVDETLMCDHSDESY